MGIGLLKIIPSYLANQSCHAHFAWWFDQQSTKNCGRGMQL